MRSRKQIIQEANAIIEIMGLNLLIEILVDIRDLISCVDDSLIRINGTLANKTLKETEDGNKDNNSNNQP